MSRTSRIGHIVWHDLFTPDRPRAMAFYQKVVGWSYLTEYSEAYVWAEGGGDYVLALAGDEAGAGLIQSTPDMPRGWVPYVEVPDVDACAEQAAHLGGTLLRPPFEVPGVGRNALLRDPNGASVGICLSRHDFPEPRLQFGPETYLSHRSAFPTAFYASLFGWAAPGPTGPILAIERPSDREQAAWLPSLRVETPAQARQTALAHGAIGRQDTSILADPDQALFALVVRATP